MRIKNSVMSTTKTRRTKPTGCYVGSEDAFQRTAITLVRSIAATQGVPKEAVMHIPNGGQRNAIVGAKLKGMGTVPGYPDIMVFKPIVFTKKVLLSKARCFTLEDLVVGNAYTEEDRLRCGLALELKVWPNKPTPEQLHIHALLKEAGWKVAVCYGIDEVCSTVNEYFGIK